MALHSLGDNEKRNYIRMNVEAEILCRIGGTSEEFKGFCRNLSHTGLQFITSKKIEEGTEMDIMVKVNGIVDQPPLKAKLTVKRVDKEKDQYVVSGTMKDVV